MRLHMFSIAALALAAAVPASAQAGDKELSEKAVAALSKFERTGEMKSCLRVTQISEMNAIDERHFLVRVGVNNYYLNTLSGRCSGADRSWNRIQYKTGTADLCSNQIITIVDNNTGFVQGSCGLGDFERLESKPSEDEAAES